MNEIHLNRVREDLAAMRLTLGLQLRFERGHVWANLGLALAGAVVAALTGWTSLSSVPTARFAGALDVYWAGHHPSTPCTGGDGDDRSSAEGLRTSPVARVSTGFGGRHRRRTPLPRVHGLGREPGASAGAITACTLFLAGLFLLAPRSPTGACATPSVGPSAA